jgi:ketosteroid isomerase-like protein
MSSGDNVELVRGVFAAFAARDLDAIAPMLDPELEIRPAIAGSPEGVVYHGPEGMREFWREVDAAWDEFLIEADEFHDLGARVLVLGRVHARGAGSGIVLDSSGGWLAEVRAGRLLRFQSFTNPAAALEAAGVRK